LARQKEKIYKRRRPLRTLLRVLGVSLLVTLVLVVALFFRLQRYIVHTPDGIRLDIPILRGILDEIPEWSDEPFPTPPPPTPTPSADPELPPPPPEAFRGLWVRGETLETAPDWNQTLEGFQADALLVAMNDETGRLWWESDVDMASRFALSGEGDPGPILETIDEEFGRSALLFGFHNQLMANRNPPMALEGAEGWLDPESIEMRDYLMDLALELARLGFDEIVLIDFTFPQNYEEADDPLILNFLRELSVALGTLDVALSVMTRAEDWYTPEYDPEEDTPPPLFRPNLALLLDIVSRFYCLLDPETLAEEDRFEALLTAAQSVLGNEMHRFVPVGTGSGPEEGNWVMIP